MIEDFFSEDEVAEMLGAGKAMCFDAPKEQRKVFSTTDPSTSQVIDTINILIKISLIMLSIYIFRIKKRILLNRVTKSVISLKLVL